MFNERLRQGMSKTTESHSGRCRLGNFLNYRRIGIGKAPVCSTSKSHTPGGLRLGARSMERSFLFPVSFVAVPASLPRTMTATGDHLTMPDQAAAQINPNSMFLRSSLLEHITVPPSESNHDAPPHVLLVLPKMSHTWHPFTHDRHTRMHAQISHIHINGMCMHQWRSQHSALGCNVASGISVDKV